MADSGSELFLESSSVTALDVNTSSGASKKLGQLSLQEAFGRGDGKES